ncbi:hypothetical protein [Natrinema sp. SYSU A 869]|uniref:hypothetical protein n=1 Tax=Natrinema sp. SYSU A 869 TaxID=2871694 RepID=UPI001CA3EEE3|nr:hypothetical protein [Natrinema sp. SYSU A 869]
MIDLVFSTGSNVNEFCISLDVPRGVETKTIQPTSSEVHLTDSDTIEGVAPPNKDRFVVPLILETTSGVGPEGKYIVFSDEKSDRILLSVKLLQNQ